MTREETIQALKDALESAGFDSSLRLTLINAIEHLQGEVIPGAFISRNRYTKTNILHFSATCDAVQRLKSGDVIVTIRNKED